MSSNAAPRTLHPERCTPNAAPRSGAPEPHTLRAEVEVMNSYSAHADGEGLLHFIDQMEARPERLFLVHGAPERQAAFEAALHEHGYDDVIIPEHGESVAL